MSGGRNFIAVLCGAMLIATVPVPAEATTTTSPATPKSRFVCYEYAQPSDKNPVAFRFGTIPKPGSTIIRVGKMTPGSVRVPFAPTNPTETSESAPTDLTTSADFSLASGSEIRSYSPRYEISTLGVTGNIVWSNGGTATASTTGR